MSSSSLAHQIETTFATDDSDVLKERYGEPEQHIAHTVLLLASVPALSIPLLFHALRKSINIAILLLASILAITWFIIQKRFDLIILLSNHYQELLNARI